MSDRSAFHSTFERHRASDACGDPSKSSTMLMHSSVHADRCSTLDVRLLCSPSMLRLRVTTLKRCKSEGFCVCKSALSAFVGMVLRVCVRVFWSCGSMSHQQPNSLETAVYQYAYYRLQDTN